MTSEPLNQYTEICRDAIKSSSAKLSKTFENLLLEILLLYMTIQRKINFTQWSLGEVECCGLPCELTAPPGRWSLSPLRGDTTCCMLSRSSRSCSDTVLL